MNQFDKVLTSLNKTVFSNPENIVVLDISTLLDTFVQGEAHCNQFLSLYREVYSEICKDPSKILVLDFTDVFNVGSDFLQYCTSVLVKQNILSSEIIDSKVFIKGNNLFIKSFYETLKNSEVKAPEISITEVNELVKTFTTLNRYKNLLESSSRNDRTKELESVKESLKESQLKIDSLPASFRDLFSTELF